MAKPGREGGGSRGWTREPGKTGEPRGMGKAGEAWGSYAWQSGVGGGDGKWKLG